MAEIRCQSCEGENPRGFKFCGHCGAKLDVVDSSASDAGPEDERSRAASDARDQSARGHLHDERRQVTVLFADVSGFTSMSEAMDPEDVHAAMNSVFARLGSVINEHGGHIDKYIGDCVMALFGAPVAHADDPERACRAALALHASLEHVAAELRHKTGVATRMRVGINDGDVVAGSVGSAGASQYTVMGDAVNLASRLESAAEPGTTLVSRTVRRAARHAFGFGPAQQLTVKGKQAPVEAFALLEERGLSVADDDSSPVGQDEVVDALVSRLDRGVSAVLLAGPSGVGRRRIAAEVASRLGRGLIATTANGAHQQRPFELLRRIAVALLHHATGDARSTRSRDAVASAVARIAPSAQPYVDPLWELLGQQVPQAAAPGDPESLRRLIELGFRTLITEAPDNLMIYVSDWQDVDAASAELLANLADSMHGLPLTILASLDPVATHAPTSGFDTVRVPPLDDSAMRSLLDNTTGNAALPDTLRERMLRLADGMPGTLRELVESLIDNGVLKQHGDELMLSADTATSSDFVLPGSLRSAVTARLDRLEPTACDLLQQVSVQGVVFDLDIARAVREAPRWRGPSVGPLAERLEARHLIAHVAGTHRATRRFERELLRDVCYENLLRSNRRDLHARIADALRERSGTATAWQVVARHESLAGRWLAAASAYCDAGDQAASVFVNDVALDCFRAAIAAAEHCKPDEPSLTSVRFRAHGGAGRILMRRGQYDDAANEAARMAERLTCRTEQAEASRLAADIAARAGKTDDAQRGFERAIELAAGDVDAADVLGESLHDLAKLHHRAGRLDEAAECVVRCREVGGPNATMHRLRADLLEGTIQHTRGRLRAACECYDRALTRAETMQSVPHIARSANSLGNALRDRGEYREARRYYEKALDMWSRIEDAECIAGVHSNLGNVAMSIGEFDAAEDHYRDALLTAERIANPFATALARANLGILAVEADDGGTAVARANASLDLLHGGDRTLAAMVRVVRGEGRLLLQQIDLARADFSHVLAEHTPQTHPLAVAGARRGLGRARLHEGDIDGAVRELSEARDLFGQLGRTQEAARTKMWLADAALLQGRIDDAHRLASAAIAECEAICVPRDIERARSILASVTQAAASSEPPS